MGIKLFRDRVMVEFVESSDEKVLASGIILPKGDQDDREKRYPTIGKVVVLGPDVGEKDLLNATVIFDRYNHKEISYRSPDGDKNKRYLVMEEKHILAIVGN